MDKAWITAIANIVDRNPRLRYTFAHGGNFPCFSIDVNSFLCIGLEEVVQIFRGHNAA